MEGSRRGGVRKGAGRPRGKNYKCITLTLDEEAVIMLKSMAKEKGMTLSQFITDHFHLPYYKNLPTKEEMSCLDTLIRSYFHLKMKIRMQICSTADFNLKHLDFFEIYAK